MRKFLALDTLERGVWVKLSTIMHPDSELDFLASRKIGKGEGVWYYNGSLVYTYLIKDLSKTKMYGKGMMQVAAEAFRRLTNKLLEKVTDKEGVEHQVWIVPALLCGMWSMNNTKYLPAEITPEIGSTSNPRKSNVHIMQSRSPSSPKDFKILSVQVLHRALLREEPLVHYRNKQGFDWEKD